ncbi:hypothetical protein T02_2852 [Trichinella nativa]|uniref:Uncharacterized protein n=1 Tax=Trichinella nativa TaxID=6335 RepID=A0A0V1LF19_9BILA|nr:hypothetical protein T02_2852 [Trichinella nativa]
MVQPATGRPFNATTGMLNYKLCKRRSPSTISNCPFELRICPIDGKNYSTIHARKQLYNDQVK